MNNFLLRLCAVAIATSSLCAISFAQRGAQIIVKYRSGIGARKALNTFEASPQTFSVGGAHAHIAATFSSGGSTSFPKENFLTLTLADPAALQATLNTLANDPAVEYAQKNSVHHIDGATSPKKFFPRTQSFVPNDSAYSSQWNLPIVHAPEAWEIEKGNADVLIAFVDTGIDWDHPDFYSAAGTLATLHINPAEDINHDGLFEPWSKDSSYMYHGALRSGDLDGIDEDGDGYVDDVIGYDFVDQAVPNIGDWSGRDPIPFDENSHGTAIAGVMAAQTNNTIGIAGVAFGCKLLAVRAFDATGNGEDDDIAAGIIYAADFSSSDGARVRVINLSFGDVIASPIMHDAISYAKQKGIVIVCSSGNNGGTGAHYPSNYPECISVGATDEDDNVIGTSGGGSALALVAPGADIVTTIPGNMYASENGTSVASPHVAAAAALLCSHDPSLTSDEVRGILQTTSDDIDIHGWDTRSGAGRLNVFNALQSFAAQINLSSPRQDTGLTQNNIVATGTIALPYFSFYRVFIGSGDDPSTWILLRDTTRRQVLNDTLAVWNASAFPDSSYVMRLVVNTSNNTTIESRARFFLERTAPQKTKLNFLDVLAGDHHAIMIDLRADQPTTFSVSFRPKGSSENFVAKKQIDQFTYNHYIILDNTDLAADAQYELYAGLTNAAGVTTRVDAGGPLYTVTRSGVAFPTTAFVQKPYYFNGSVLLNAAADIFGDNKKCIAALDENFGGGLFRVAEFSNGNFVTRDSIFSQYIPRGMGATRGDGLLQLWSQSGLTSKLFTQTAAHGLPLHALAFADTSDGIYAAGMADLDGDGVEELIAMSGADLVIYKFQSGNYSVLARLPNPTPPGLDQATNFFSYPNVAVGDFDGDGKQEILVGDGDADFYIYEYDPATKTFTNTFTDLNDGEDAFVTAGDFNGDGKMDFAYAFHSSLAWNADREYDTPFWTIKMFMSDADNHYTLAWSTTISIVKPPATYRSGLAAGNLDGVAGDELFINTFPNSYIFKWDASRQAFAPMQYFPFGATNTAIIADFDNNALNEIGFYTGNETDFFEFDSSRTAPATPLNFVAVPIDSTHAQLSWNAVANATRYVIYRGKFLPTDPTVQMDSVAGTTATNFLDSLLTSRSWYDYAIVAITGDARGVPTPEIAVYVHPQAQLKKIVPHNSSVEAVFSELMPQAAITQYVVNDNKNGSASVAVASDSTLLMSWSAPLISGSHTLQCVHLFDRFGLLVDTLPFAFDVQIKNPADTFYILNSSVPDANHIVLQFSCDVDSADARMLSHYTLSPEGTIDSAMRDISDHSKVILTLDNNSSIGAFGKTWTVQVTGLTSPACGVIVDGAGSTAGIELHREDLSALFVYPNPSRISATDHCTFANLTPQAEIIIYTMSGARVADITEQSASGGVDWNLHDLRGDAVGTGVYLFYATGKNSLGGDVEAKLGKFAIVR